MFSVYSDQPVRLNTPNYSFLFGYEPTTFSYRNGGGSGEENDFEDLSFTDPIYRFRTELRGFQGYLGLGVNLGDDSINLLNAGAQLDGEYRLTRNPNFSVGIPLVLSTDYTQIASRTGTNRAEDFRQSSAMVGAGLAIRASIGNRFRIESRIVPLYGFTVTSFGAAGGTRGSITTQNRIYVDQLHGRFGLTAGFDYRTSRYNLEDDRFNYDLTSNSIVIGITF